MTRLTRVEFIKRVIDILRRSDVDDAEYLVGLLEQHTDDAFDPGCGLKRHGQEEGPCILPAGHDGYHKDKWGGGWQVYPPSRPDDE